MTGATPKAVRAPALQPARTPVLRLGPRVVMSDGFTNGGSMWDVSGGGTVDVVDDVLEVVTGTVDTVLESAEFVLVPGVNYEAELNVLVNNGTIQAEINGQTPIPATSATGIVRGEFEAQAALGTLVVTASGAAGSVVEISRVRVKLF